MSLIIKLIITFYFYEIFIINSILLSLFSIPLFIISPSGRTLHKLIVISAKIIFFFSGCRLFLLSKNPYNKYKNNIIIVANHQSLFDILVLYILFDKLQFKWVIKKSLFYIPFFGFPLLYMARYIKLDRKNRIKAYKAVEKSVYWLKKGFSMIIFPEGTRSKEDKVNEFKMGGVKIAFKAETDIIPVVLYGTLFIKSKQKKLVNPSPVFAKILNKRKATNLDLHSQKILLKELEENIRVEYNKLKEIVKN